MVAAAATGGEVTLRGVIPKHMETVTEKLREMGIGVVEHRDSDSITVTGRPTFRSARIETQAYPGFPTDMHLFIYIADPFDNSSACKACTSWEIHLHTA